MNAAIGEGVNKQWITIGGSYPGALSAWFKSQYPEYAFAAWSSSGVINPSMDFFGYDEGLYTSTMRSGTSCTKVIQGIYLYIEEVFNNSATR